MKKLQIGELSIDVAETINDINAKRWNEIKSYIIFTESGMNLPSLKNTFIQFTNGFDNRSQSEMFKALYDFVLGLSNIEKDIDADQMIFALMTYEDGEDRTNTDTTHLREKINRFSQHGLTQGQIIDHVRNFISALTIR